MVDLLKDGVFHLVETVVRLVTCLLSSGGLVLNPAVDGADQLIKN